MMAISALMNLGGRVSVLSTHDIEHAVSGYYDVTHGVVLVALLSDSRFRRGKPGLVLRVKTCLKKTYGIEATEEWFASIGLSVKLSDVGATPDKAEEIGAIAEKGDWGL